MVYSRLVVDMLRQEPLGGLDEFFEKPHCSFCRVASVMWVNSVAGWRLWFFCTTYHTDSQGAFWNRC